MRGVGPKKQGLLRARSEISKYADSPIGSFVAITDWAESNGLDWTVRWRALNFRTMINESSCQKNELRLHLTIRSGSNKKITFFAQRGHLAAHQWDPILLGLGPQPLQQFRTSNPKESWIIVAQRNFGSPAFAGVNHLNMSPVSAEINRGQQTCRAATDNKAVQRLSAGVHHRPSRPLWRGTCGADTGALCPASTCARLALTFFRE